MSLQFLRILSINRFDKFFNSFHQNKQSSGFASSIDLDTQKLLLNIPLADNGTHPRLGDLQLSQPPFIAPCSSPENGGRPTNASNSVSTLPLAHTALSTPAMHAISPSQQQQQQQQQQTTVATAAHQLLLYYYYYLLLGAKAAQSASIAAAETQPAPAKREKSSNFCFSPTSGEAMTKQEFNTSGGAAPSFGIGFRVANLLPQQLPPQGSPLTEMSSPTSAHSDTCAKPPLSQPNALAQLEHLIQTLSANTGAIAPKRALQGLKPSACAGNGGFDVNSQSASASAWPSTTRTEHQLTYSAASRMSTLASLAALDGGGGDTSTSLCGAGRQSAPFQMAAAAAFALPLSIPKALTSSVYAPPAVVATASSAEHIESGARRPAASVGGRIGGHCLCPYCGKAFTRPWLLQGTL